MQVIQVAARNSPLSEAQLEEVFQELTIHQPNITFEKTLIDTTGDLDKKTSLRKLEKTDFFTKEIDELLLQKKCRIAIHSAKDLPYPIPTGLTLVAITKGVDTFDSLVLQEGMSLSSLKSGAIIATSSTNRENHVKSLRSDLTFQDIRGQIAERLNILNSKLIDGVVIAEAALIRLNLQHLNRIRLPGTTTPLQGKLAIVAHEDDHEMRTLFSCIDTKR